MADQKPDVNATLCDCPSCKVSDIDNNDTTVNNPDLNNAIHALRCLSYTLTKLKTQVETIIVSCDTTREQLEKLDWRYE